MTGETDNALTIRDPGDIRFRLGAKPLSYPIWLALQKRLMAPHVRVRRLRRCLALLAVGGVVGAAAGVTIAKLDLYGALTIVAIESGWSITVDGAKLVILSLGLVLLVYAATVLLLNAWRMRVVRRFYDGVTLLGAPGEIILTENGVFRRGAEGCSFFRWAAISEFFVAAGVWFVVVDRGSALWFDDDALGERREAVEAFLRAKINPPAPIA